jgi:hypothetical protein
MTTEAPGRIRTTHSSARRSRVMDWHDPAPGTAAGMSMPGMEYLQAMREGRLPLPPITDLLNLDLTEVDEGRVVFTCVPDESMYNAIGMIHGGVLCALLDSAASFALLSTLPEGKGLASWRSR